MFIEYTDLAVKYGVIFERFQFYAQPVRMYLITIAAKSGRPVFGHMHVNSGISILIS